MINLKSDQEVEIMRRAGHISSKILDSGLAACIPGMTTRELNQLIEEKFNEYGVGAWFKEVNNYPAASCISVNDIWLHGLPGERRLEVGDIVSIDIGVKHEGYYIDNCWSTIVQKDGKCSNIRECFEHEDSGVSKFLKDGVEALDLAISTFQVGKKTGDISFAMQAVIEGAGYKVIKEYTGHGLGNSYHEEPVIPCFGTRGAGVSLKKGMVLAIEVMYSKGGAEYKILEDNWSVASADGSLTGMFEHTVALTEEGPEILTK